MNRLLHIAGIQPACHDQFADAVDHSRPGLHSLPVEFSTRAPELARCGRVEQNATDHSRSKSVGLQKKIAVFGDVNFVDALSLVSFFLFDKTGGYRVPSHTLLCGTIENLRRAGAEDYRALHSIGHE